MSKLEDFLFKAANIIIDATAEAATGSFQEKVYEHEQQANQKKQQKKAEKNEKKEKKG